jgi:hypothetical protein
MALKNLCDNNIVQVCDKLHLHPIILQTLLWTWRFTVSCSVRSHTLHCATWKGAMSHSSSTPSYSGQPAKRSFPEATTTDCGCSGSSCTACLCNWAHAVFAQPVYHLFMDQKGISHLDK